MRSTDCADFCVSVAPAVVLRAASARLRLISLVVALCSSIALATASLEEKN